MSGISDFLGISKWVTERIDQFSSWRKKKDRENEVTKIDRSIDAHDDKSVDSIVCSIKTKRDKRTNAS